MSITKIFKESISVAKGNPLIFIPMLAASVLSALLSLIFVGSAVPMAGRFSGEQIAANPEQALAGVGVAAGAMFIIGIISTFVGLLTHSMTVAMADTALKGERATLQNGWSRIISRIVAVIIASVLMGVIVGAGFIMLVLPGIILAFFLMFTLVALIVDDLGAFKAIGQSFKTVGKNFGATFITFLVIIGLAIITGIANFIVALIPLLGAVLSLIIYALFTGFITIFIVRVYSELSVQTDASPEVEA
mgnify:CR=1 FL=1